MATIQNRTEQQRGCGYRKPGALYLVSGVLSKPCGKLPIELTVCPCCNQGIKPTRGFAWIQYKLIEDAKCRLWKTGKCECTAFEAPWNFSGEDKLGLMWVGGKYYKTPDHFSKEAAQMGISKRIAAVPKDLVVGHTWVLLAHRKAIEKINVSEQRVDKVPGIFQAFKPTAIEYIVKGTESEAELDSMEKRGITLVKVEHAQSKLL